MTYATKDNFAAMITYRRPAYGKTEREFRERFIAPLGTREDKVGNMILRIGDAPVLWSCHTDTQHRQEGQQVVAVDGQGTMYLKDPLSSCLGADDAAGVWLMREMIRAKREGLYIFHAAEEMGGVGSSWIASNTPELLAGIDFAIALDRKGTNSIITHQGGERCCSDAFARSLGRGLIMGIGPGMVPDDTGLFTDTANYVDLVPECTNLSVGYEHEHSRAETIDLHHLVAIRNALLNLNIDNLVCEREAGESDYLDYPANDHHLYDLVVQYPDLAAELLEAYGVTKEDFEAELYNERR
jgi:hypothetical protein